MLCAVLLLCMGCTSKTDSILTSEQGSSNTDAVDNVSNKSSDSNSDKVSNKDSDSDNDNDNVTSKDSNKNKNKNKDKNKNDDKDKIDSSEKLIALTFDDGPYSPVTEKILDTLEKYDAKATFFVVGNRIASYAKSVKRANDLGCEIGSHTYSHKNLTKLNSNEMKSEIDKSNEEIKKITGKDISIVRPPEGAVNDTVKSSVKYPLIMWSVDSDDWKYKNAEKDYTEVMKDVKDGSIILMHDLYPETAKAVERLIPALMVEGYKFVTVSELMEARGIKLENGKNYYKAKPLPTETSKTVAVTAK